jgi:hypothetical protein
MAAWRLLHWRNDGVAEEERTCRLWRDNGWHGKEEGNGPVAYESGRKAAVMAYLSSKRHAAYDEVMSLCSSNSVLFSMAASRNIWRRRNAALQAMKISQRNSGSAAIMAWRLEN